MLILPAIVIVGVMAVRFQGSWLMVAVFLGLTTWMTLTRIIRGMVLSLREKEFVEAAKALGASTTRIIFKHIVPNCTDVIIVSATLTIAAAVLFEAALSFIGLGVRPPDTSLGLLLNETQNYLPTANAWLFWITLAFVVLISLSRQLHRRRPARRPRPPAEQGARMTIDARPTCSPSRPRQARRRPPSRSRT